MSCEVETEQTEQSNQALLKSGQQVTCSRSCSLRPRGVEMNHARLSTAIARLPGLSNHNWDGSCEVGVKPGRCASRRRIWNRGALRLIIELVAALLERWNGQGLIQQEGAVAIGNAGSAESREIGRIAVAVSRPISDRCAGNRSQV